MKKIKTIPFVFITLMAGLIVKVYAVQNFRDLTPINPNLLRPYSNMPRMEFVAPGSLEIIIFYILMPLAIMSGILVSFNKDKKTNKSMKIIRVIESILSLLMIIVSIRFFTRSNIPTFYALKSLEQFIWIIGSVLTLGIILTSILFIKMPKFRQDTIKIEYFMVLIEFIFFMVCLETKAFNSCFLSVVLSLSLIIILIQRWFNSFKQ